MSTRESPRRRALLDVLRAAPAPLGVAEAAERMGLHPNTVRFHLDALVADGLVERRTEDPSGPGRPRTVYTARPGMDRGGPRDYRLLARMLLSRWTVADPAGARAEARETGRTWGRYLADPPAPDETPTPERSTARLLALLDGLGFAPRAEGAGEPGRPPERIRLRHCPFLELAEEQGGLVCSLHLGLIQGALARMEAPLTATALEPFAEPDSCVAHLAGASAARAF
ncbi:MULTISPECIES: helix-turn-helix transcriptional regulator [Streptomyces]|uniref:Helix-turn-helix transcriptional regulator n=1 Tax=Streptomyces eurythermus TaxID=42237 RepID=A0ABW6YPX4_9ACTN|nr:MULTISPECIES: helix-turn-helix domain-containing protein [Streptomyces]QIS74556.1 helix-turn-helix domain-containing protein [Streptomyces sp. DSM 40868]